MSSIDVSANGGGQASVASSTSHRPSLTRPVVVAAVVMAIPLILLAVLLCALIPVVPWWVGIVVGLLAAVAVVALRLRRSHDVVLGSFQSGTSDSIGVERASNLLQSLSLASGMQEPELRVMAEPSRNAAAIRHRDTATIIVTSGLLDSADVIQMEGVVAQMLTRLKNGDAEQATVGAALFGLPILGTGLKGLLGPIARFAMEDARPQDRDLQADREAVSLTRYPPGLRQALTLISEGPEPQMSVPESVAHMWIAEPAATVAAGRSDRAPLELRIDALAEL